MTHPFRDTPQWKQQYGGGLGYRDNGLGSVSGADPHDSEHDEDEHRYRRLGTKRVVHDGPDPVSFFDQFDFEDFLLAFESLTDKQKFVLTARYGLATGLGMTLEEVAGYMSISRQAVSRIEQRALHRMRALLGGLTNSP